MGIFKLNDGFCIVFVRSYFGKRSIVARIFDRNGASIGKPMKIVKKYLGYYPNIQIMPLENGNIAIFNDVHENGFSSMYATIYDSYGNVLMDAAKVAEYETQSNSAVSAFPGGGFVIAYTNSPRGVPLSKRTTIVKHFDSSLQQVGSSVSIRTPLIFQILVRARGDVLVAYPKYPNGKNGDYTSSKLMGQFMTP